MRRITDTIKNRWETQESQQDTDEVMFIGRKPNNRDLGFHGARFATSASYIMGNRGGGKTYKACVTLEQVYEAGFRFIVIDPMGEYHTLKQYLGDDMIVYGKKHSKKADREINDNNLEEVRNEIQHGNKCMVFNFEFHGEEESMKIVQQLLGPLHERRKKQPKHQLSPILIALEEAEKWLPEQGSAPTKSLFSSLAFESRHSGLGLLILGHRISAVAKDPLSQCEYPMIKKTTMDIDIDRITFMLRKDYGVDPMKVTDYVSQLTSMPPYKSMFLHDQDAVMVRDYKRKSPHHADSFGTARTYEGFFVDDR